jgi:hypothetical protein
MFGKPSNKEGERREVQRYEFFWIISLGRSELTILQWQTRS